MPVASSTAPQALLERGSATRSSFATRDVLEIRGHLRRLDVLRLTEPRSVPQGAGGRPQVPLTWALGSSGSSTSNRKTILGLGMEWGIGWRVLQRGS